MTALTYTTELIRTSCWCGIPLAIPETLYDEAKAGRVNVYCPIGHTFVYGDTLKKKLAQVEENLAAERRRVQATRELLAAEERSHAATRGHLTRTKKRVAAGVCPCCNRTFKQLSRHMENKHPEYVEENPAS